MPGPKAGTPRRKGRPAAPNSPNAKTRARLDARIAGWPTDGANRENKQKMHKPGSQNRKKR